MTHESEPLPPPARALWRSLRLGYRTEPRLLIVAFVTAMVAAAPDALFAVALSALVTSVVEFDQRGIMLAAGSLGVLVVANWLLGLVNARINMRLTNRAAVDIEAYILRLHAGVPTIEHHERADHVDRLSLLRDHAAALSELYQMLFNSLGIMLRLLITVALLASIRPELLLVGLFLIPPILVSSRRGAAEKAAEEAGAQLDRRARSMFTLGTTPEAAKEIRVAQVQQRLMDRSRKDWDVRYKVMARARTLSALWLAVAYAGFGLALIAGVWRVTQGPNAVGDVTLAIAAGSRLSQYAGQAVRDTHLFRVIWLDCARRLAWLEDFAQRGASVAVGPAPEILRDGLRLEQVSFRYPGTDRYVLKDVDLDIPAGKIVAIVGENGAGKSTLVKLLCRYYEPSRGRILVDGQDLMSISVTDWRSKLSGAFQDFVKFEYKLREAVGLGDVSRSGDEATVASALDQAGASTLVSSLPAGLDTQLGAGWPDGIDLSQGQWQKTALARSNMRPHPLVVFLDEPTSALDAEAEHELFERYAERAHDDSGRGRITVLVSHRFSTVRTADLILVVNGSTVSEWGSHAELMALGGLYAELYGIQASAYAAHHSNDASDDADADD